jgi:hypothetical protein
MSCYTAAHSRLRAVLRREAGMIGDAAECLSRPSSENCDSRRIPQFSYFQTLLDRLSGARRDCGRRDGSRQGLSLNRREFLLATTSIRPKQRDRQPWRHPIRGQKPRSKRPNSTRFSFSEWRASARPTPPDWLDRRACVTPPRPRSVPFQDSFPACRNRASVSAASAFICPLHLRDRNALISHRGV